VIPPVLLLQRHHEITTATVVGVHGPAVSRILAILRRETELCAKGAIPIGVIRAEIPCPGAPCGRFECNLEPRFLFPECRFGAGAVDRVPGPLGDLADELDLSGRPYAWSVVIDAERGNHLRVFEPRHADNGRDLHRPERRPVVIAEPLIRLHVIDNNGLAAPERIA
jgi:hypothetical protein